MNKTLTGVCSDRGPEPARDSSSTAPRSPVAAGYSMIEVILASVLIMLMAFAIGTLAISGTDAQELGRRIGRMTEMAQDSIDDLRVDLVSSIHIFNNDPIGNACLAQLDLTSAPVPTPIATRRLPTMDVTGSFRRDTAGNEITGNAFFFAKLAWRDQFTCTSGNSYIVDVYRWVHVYQSPIGSGPGPGVRGGLDLVKVFSEPLVDGGAIDGIGDPVDQAELLLHLVQGTPDSTGLRRDPAHVVWLRGADPALPTTLRQIDPSTGLLSDDPLPGRSDPWTILLDEDSPGGTLAFRQASIASNFEAIAPGVNRFGIRDDGLGFPHGLEFQVVGPSAARQILLHIVLVDRWERGQEAWSQLQTLIDARDL